MIRLMKLLAGALLASALVACGGGGGSAGTVTGGSSSNPNTNTATASVSDFALFTDKTSINNSGADSAKLTVQAVDANRNVVSGARVTVTANNGAVFVPVGTATDSSGQFTGTLLVGSDKSDRDVTLSVTINGITKQTAVRVSGTKLTLTVDPAAPSPGQAVTLAAQVQDSAGNPIQGAQVRLGGTVPELLNRTITTSLTGVGTTTFVAPAAPGTYNITATGNGTNAPTYQLQVFNSSVPVAVIPLGATPSLAASPNVLATNAPGSTTSKSTLRFLFLDSNNNPVSNVRVRFEDTTTGLAKVGASLASGTNVLYTDASGSVTTQYIAGQNSSPTNGVTVRACYSASDFLSSTDCPASVTASLTIAGQALSVSIGDDNLLQKVSGTYVKQFAVTVADSAGRAVPNAPVDISVDLTHYGKGQTSLTFSLATVPTSLAAAFPDFTTDPSANSGQRVWCPNEDFNRNGNVDSGENVNGSIDSNGQPTLEPRKSDLLISYVDPTKTTTDASGVLLIKVQYSQRFGTWLAYKVRVTANVAGSQGMAERLFITDVLADDVVNGSFLEPPYGIRACNSPN